MWETELKKEDILKHLIIVFFLAFLILGCKKEQTKSIDTPLEDYFKNSSIPSAVMGTIDANGKTTWYRFGPSIWEDSTTAVTEDNIFRIYSMTKAITSVAALQLVEKGLIGLDDPLNELMPEMVSIPILDEDGKLFLSDASLTLRQLLNHTSGFGLFLFSEKLYNFKSDNWEFEDKPRLFQPGTSFAYGTGINWAGKIIEKISGQDLET